MRTRQDTLHKALQLSHSPVPGAHPPPAFGAGPAPGALLSFEDFPLLSLFLPLGSGLYLYLPNLEQYHTAELAGTLGRGGGGERGGGGTATHS